MTKPNRQYFLFILFLSAFLLMPFNSADALRASNEESPNTSLLKELNFLSGGFGVNIKANGIDDELTVSPVTPVSLTVSVETDIQGGDPVDWFLFVETESGIYTFLPSGLWESGLKLSLRSPLFSLLEYEVFNTTFEEGRYKFTFSIDNNGDGIYDGTTNDSVEVNVRSSSNEEGDSYEEDDSYDKASVIILNDTEPQSHNFHDYGDEDWVMFYGVAGQIYTIEVSNPGSYCDPVIELYDSDSMTMLHQEDRRWYGEDESLDRTIEKDGIYYVKISHAYPDNFGENTEYELSVYNPRGAEAGFIQGEVTDSVTGEPIAMAILKTDMDVTAISLPNGYYLMSHPEGTFTITVEADGYKTLTDTVEVCAFCTVTKDFSMESIF